ncbi:hypothetical protein AAHE18_07G199300 [Arachis hypogaea]
MVPTRIASLSRFRLHQHMGTLFHSIFNLPPFASFHFPIFHFTSIVSATNLDDHDDCERNNKRNDFRNSLIDKCKLGKLSNVGEAFDLFHSMAMMKPLPSVFDFTLLLGVIVRMKHYTTVISLVQYMYSSLGIKPDCFTLNIVINCLCRIKLTPFGFSVFASMLKLGLEPPLSTFTALINGLCMQGDVARAVGTLESLKSMGYQLDVYTYGALINGLCKMGDTNAAIEWLHKMEERDCRSNVVVHSTIIDSLCKDELVSEALNMFSEMCSKGIKPNIVTYSCLIQGLCNFGRWKDAASLLDEMMKVGMMPDLQTLNILVDVFCKDGKMPFTYNALIDRHCLQKEINEAMKIFNSMVTRGCLPDIVTYTSLIHGWCMIKNINKAMHLLNEMVNTGFVPDVVTWTTLIGGMHKHGQMANLQTCAVMLDGLCKCQLLSEATSLFELMEKSGLDLNIVIYNIMLDGMWAVGEVKGAWKLFSSLPAKGQCKQGLIDEAEDLLTNMEENGCPPNYSTYNVFVQGLLIKRDPLRSMKYLQIMTDKGFSVDATTTELIINYLSTNQGDTAFREFLFPKR